METITLYHGTSLKNANNIMSGGFKDRVRAKKSNWKGKIISQSGFVYLTIAYPFFYGNASAGKRDKKASVIKVEVDSKDLYPDEDFIRQGGKIEGKIDIEDYKQHGELSLIHMGNVAVKPEKIEVIDRKDFDIVEMCLFADPSMSIMNFKILGDYYTKLTNNWFHDKKWKITFEEYIKKGGKKYVKTKNKI